MTGGMKRLRGQPLAVLLALLAGWLGARATTWQWPGTLAEQVLSDTALAVEPGGGADPRRGGGPCGDGGILPSRRRVCA